MGGENLIRGLEFTSISNVEVKGELEEFIDILKLLEKKHDVKLVEIIIGDLPEGRKGKRFSRLSDGITKRKYAIGKITMMDDEACSLIEVEREDKALSMILLKGNILVNWKMIYSIILLGLVNESGKWSNRVMEKIKNQGIVVIRKNILRKIYMKLKSNYTLIYKSNNRIFLNIVSKMI